MKRFLTLIGLLVIATATTVAQDERTDVDSYWRMGLTQKQLERIHVLHREMIRLGQEGLTMGGDMVARGQENNRKWREGMQAIFVKDQYAYWGAYWRARPSRGKTERAILKSLNVSTANMEAAEKLISKMEKKLDDLADLYETDGAAAEFAKKFFTAEKEYNEGLDKLLSKAQQDEYAKKWTAALKAGRYVE